MSLSRRGMRSPRDIPAPPGLVAEVMLLIRERSENDRLVAAARSDKDNRDIHRKLEKIMAQLNELLDAVSAQQTQVDSLIELTNGLHARVLEAFGGTITPSQQMRIDQVFEAVRQNADDIAAAIKENTVEASSGAISGGPSASDIKASLGQGGNGGTGEQSKPTTDPANPGNAPAGVGSSA